MVAMIRSDLDFILAQIKIAEADARGEPLLGTLIPNSELPWGLRRVDGSNNNLLPGQGNFGAADQPFIDAVNGGTPLNEADDGMRFGPPVPGLPGGTTADGIVVPPGYAVGINFLTQNNYGVHTPNNPAIIDPRAIQPGDVVDADPRTISNLIVDQTANNPAAVYKALQMAGVANPFEAMGQVTAAVQLIKAEKADLIPLQSTVTAAQTAYTAALALQTPAGQAQILAYQVAATASENLRTVTGPAVDVVTSALVAAMAAGTPTATADDIAALNDAKAAIDAMIADAQAMVTALTPYAGADLTTATVLLADLQQVKSSLALVNLADGTVDILDNILATGIADVSNGLPARATAIDAQIDVAAAALNAPVQAALDAVTAATLALTTARVDVTTAETALRTLLTTTLGVSIEESANNDILKGTLLIVNVAPDAGLSAPFNGWMTLFGQFFDHGLDLLGKGGFGTVYIPLQPDDPLYVAGGSTNFMALTRSTLDENGKAINKVTPFVDQNQTYTSHASAQVFHREYEMRDGKPFATGRLLNGSTESGGGLATWADIKAQALNKLGIALDDFDIHNIPLLATDPYGNFIPGPNGFPMVVLAGPPQSQVSGTPSAPVDASFAVKTGHAFLDDISHNANPGQFDNLPGPGVNLVNETADVDLLTSTAAERQATGTYDNELLDKHFITGDGRGNENIGLTAVHHVFHSEHNRQVDLVQNLILGEARDAAIFAAANPTNVDAQSDAADKLAFLNEWLVVDLTPAQVSGATVAAAVWDGQRLFQAAKFPTEMQYQHLVFEEFARTVQPFVNVFNDFDGQLNPAILSEFAHTVYRFGHSMLTETVDRLDANNNVIGTGGVAGPNAEQIGLIEAFLNPVEFSAGGMTAEQATGAITRGMTRQRGNEIDEFVTEALRNNLVGLPLDLAALNIARGRETNVPTLNEARAEFYAGSSDAQVRPYISWVDFAANIKNPASIINFVAAYGNHASVLAETTVAGKRDAATALVLGDSALIGAAATTFNNDRLDFLNHRGIYATDTSLGGLNTVDFWVGGLAEKQMPFGGMLGTTFNFVFEVQMENLQNGDRFYYLSRLANLNLTAQLENNKFAELIARNSDADHLPGNVFKAMDYQLEADQSRQYNAGAAAFAGIDGVLGDNLATANIDESLDDVANAADPTGIANGLDPFLGNINGDAKVIRVAPTGVDPTGQYANYLQFVGGEHVVLGGTALNDILIGDEGDDTLWGDGGDDRIDGGIGNDFAFGGDGNDIITDQFGDDEIRSGAGNDVVSGGQGINLIITDLGNDFVWGGPDDEEFLLGQGNDFAAGGAGIETILGGEGNDWIEGGLENGLLLGDNGDLIQGLPIKRSVDSPVIGHDVLVSTGGNQDFDAESGDDIMVGGLGTERFFGALGFDWATYKNDPTGLEADMANRLFAPPSIAGSPSALLDRYAQTESLSGSRFTDFLRGDDETDLGGGGGELPANALVVGIPPDNSLKDRNVSLIEGLDAFLGTVNEVGENRFSAGNILLGGAGSDVLEGRGGDDLIDGDRWLDVQIKVNPAVGSTFNQAFFVQGMADIQERLFTGEIKVAQLEIVRSIKTDGALPNLDVDVAEFSGKRADYAVEGLQSLATGETLATSAGFAADVNGDGFISVVNLTRNAAGAIDVGAVGTDGTDKLKNIERLLFSDQTIKATDHLNTIATGSVTLTSSLANFAIGSVLTANLAGIVDADGLPVFTGPGAETNLFTVFWQVEFTPDSGVYTSIQNVVADEFAPVTGPTFTLTAAEAGLNVRALVRFKDDAGAVETLISPPVGSGVGVAGAPIVPDPAIELGLNLAGMVVDGVVLPAGTLGILEDATVPFSFTVAQLLSNIIDPNGDTVTIVPNTVVLRAVNGGAPGILAFNAATQTYTVTPAANFNGGITIGYDVTDGTSVLAAEAVLQVIAVNDAPVAGTNTANIGAAVATAGATITFTEAQLIGNATDIDGDVIRLFRSPDPTLVGADQFVQLATPTQGTIVLNADGSFTFTAAGGFTGPVQLNYTITDRIADITTTATLNLTDANPTAGPTLSDATPTAGQALTVNTAAIADANGVTGPFTIVWQQAATATGPFTTIGGATGATFTPGPGQVGQFIGAQVTFVDGGGNTEIVFVASASAAGDTFTGTAGNNIIDGTPEADVINGLAGADTLNGLAGDDAINGGLGADTLNGGDGNDTLTGGAANDVVNGGDGDDTAIWNVGDGRDVVNGGLDLVTGDTFVVNGNATDEAFRVYARADWIAAAGNAAQQTARAATLQAGSDIIITRNGTANGNVVAELDEIEEIVINTGAGTDTVEVIGDFNPTNLNFNTIHVNNSGGDDTVDVTGRDSDHRVVLTSTGTGNGAILGQGLRDQIIEEPVNDPVLDEDENEDENENENEDENDDVNDDGGVDQDDESDDTAGNGGSGTGTTGNGGAGSGAALPHVIHAGAHGAAFGGGSDDNLVGGNGDDSLFGMGGADNIVAGDGNDNVIAGEGADIVASGAGNDRVFGDGGDDLILAGAGDDRVMAGAGDDRIFGEAGRDVINGGQGDDVIFAARGDGNDVIHGDDGIDTVNYEEVTGSLVIDLDAGIARSAGTDAGQDVLSGIENAIGGQGANTFYANELANILTGGASNDTFVFRTAADANGDTIEGFQTGDNISLSSIFGTAPMTILSGTSVFNAAGQIRLVADNDGNTKIEGNTDSDGDIDFSLLVMDHVLEQKNFA